ncbi:MAG: TSUP family transporter, partial [Candidatus Borkfalkia sp.]
MRFIVYMFAGLAGGILGGMGMGGGTVLIPILTIFCGVEQHLAQSANLITFLPMAIFSLQVHAKHGLLDTRGIGYIIL